MVPPYATPDKDMKAQYPECERQYVAYGRHVGNRLDIDRMDNENERKEQCSGFFQEFFEKEKNKHGVCDMEAHLQEMDNKNISLG
jgi:hypothetical protein